MSLQEHPHNRYNPLTGEWILVSPHRTKRPWQGQTDKQSIQPVIKYDPDCYLCPGNARAEGVKNPQYKDVFVFTNDFSALLDSTPEFSVNESQLLKAKSEKGICKVICFSPDHNLTLSLMETAAIEKVIRLWVDEYTGISKIPFIKYIQIFENHGAQMGCSNPHPHCQIWANETIPVIPSKEDFLQAEYFKANKRCLLCDYLEKEKSLKERVVFENDHFMVVVPFWAVWPFETMIIPKSHLTGIDQMNSAQINCLADAARRLAIRYDNLFLTNFPYSMGIHQRPVNNNNSNYDHWHFHLHYYPPLLRSSTIQKFMVGYEMMANPQRDMTAEKSAAMLLNQLETHFTKKEPII